MEAFRQFDTETRGRLSEAELRAAVQVMWTSM